MKKHLVIDDGGAFRQPVSKTLHRRDDIKQVEATNVQREPDSVEEKLLLQTTALEAAANGIAITERDGTILWVNRAFTKLTGYTAEEVVGRNPRVLKSGRHDLEFYDDLWATITAGNVWRGEVVNRRKDGSCYLEEMTITPVRGVNGEVRNFVAIKQDVTQRNCVEEALRRSQQEFKDMFDNAPVGFHEIDAEGRLVRINNTELNMLGYSAGELLGQFVWKLSAEEEVSRQATLAKLSGEPPPPQGFERRLRRKDGSAFPVLINDRLLKRENGSILGIRSGIQDITEWKQAEEKLELFRALIEQTYDAIEVIDPVTARFLDINQTTCLMLGYTRDELLAMTVFDVDLEVDRAEFDKSNAKMATTGHLTFESRHRRKDGTTFPVEVSLSLVKLDRDYAVATVRDISRRKRIEKELAHKSDLLQALMDNLPDLIYFKDTHSRFTHINQAQAHHLGLKHPEEAAGKSDADFFPAHLARQKLADEQCMLANGTPILGLIEKSDTVSGARWVSSTKVPIFGPDGQITGLVGISRDITESKQAELERQRMEVQFRQSQKLESIGQLAAGIAHEINTPTQYVGDNTRFMKESFVAIMKVLKSHEALLAAAKTGGVMPELVSRSEEILAASDLDYLYAQIPSAIEETLEGIERVSKIVRAMKEFSHPGAKEKSAADLNKAIESTVTVARNEWKYVAQMKLELDPGLPLVPCFVGEFNQCILNLVVNAAHAIGDVVKENSGTKGLITVQTRLDGDHAEVRVADTGTGIPEAARPKIFEPFFTTKDVGKGTGQGLAMVYGSVVNRHGGTVTFETETGKGTTFIIRLPIKPIVGSDAVPPPKNPAP